MLRVLEWITHIAPWVIVFLTIWIGLSMSLSAYVEELFDKHQINFRTWFKMVILLTSPLLLLGIISYQLVRIVLTKLTQAATPHV